VWRRRWRLEAQIQVQSRFNFFIFINWGGQLICLGKSVIYHDLIFEVDGLPASVNPFCLPRKELYVVV